jgi:hypothetical protein
MLDRLTADISAAFVYGAAGMLGGGLLFEQGRRYVKTAGSNLFKGKIEALPFFFGVVVFGWVLQRLSPMAEGFATSVPMLARLGIILVGTMVLFNHSIERFRYTDPKSLVVYVVGGGLIAIAML